MYYNGLGITFGHALGAWAALQYKPYQDFKHKCDHVLPRTASFLSELFVVGWATADRTSLHTAA